MFGSVMGPMLAPEGMDSSSTYDQAVLKAVGPSSRRYSTAPEPPPILATGLSSLGSMRKLTNCGTLSSGTPSRPSPRLKESWTFLFRPTLTLNHRMGLSADGL